MSAMQHKKMENASGLEDMNFNASLDALLASENIHPGTATSTGANSSFVPLIPNVGGGGMHAMNTATMQSPPPQPLPPQGLQLAPTGVPVTTATAAQMQQLNSLSGVPTSSSQYPAMPGNFTPYPLYESLPTTTGPATTSHAPLSMATGDYGHASEVVSLASSRSGGRKGGTASKSRKHPRDASAVSEDEGERVRRRQDRNLREQQRSQKITHQIEHLRDILAAANVQFKPDKYSTLISVSDYIKDLQERSTMLDLEHKNLVETISRTNEVVNEQYIPASATGANPPGSADIESKGTTAGATSEALHMPNIDYKSVFERCGVPLAVLSIDGRFLSSNEQFEKLTGYHRDTLLPTNDMPDIPESSDDFQMPNDIMSSTDETASKPAATGKNMSLFNLLGREHMERVFVSMSEMLRQNPEVSEPESTPQAKDYWSGIVALAQNLDHEFRMNLSLVRSPAGQAKFFDCSLTPLSEVSIDQVM